jgi:hypothetical protein
MKINFVPEHGSTEQLIETPNSSLLQLQMAGVNSHGKIEKDMVKNI